MERSSLGKLCGVNVREFEVPLDTGGWIKKVSEFSMDSGKPCPVIYGHTRNT